MSSYASDALAGDRYRLSAMRAPMMKRLLGRKGAVVEILDPTGNVVWKREVDTLGQARSLADLIRSQVFSAPLQDFEHWLRTEGAAAT